MLLVVAVAVGALLVYLFVFEVGHTKALNESYTQQLYYQAMLYKASNYSDGDLYDASDSRYDYITDAAKIAPEFDRGGKVEIAFDKDSGNVVYAKWYPPNEGWAGGLAPEYAVYPREG